MSRRPTQSERLEDALQDLLARIENDEEYPDASWVVACGHGVPYERLAQAYDEHCGSI